MESGRELIARISKSLDPKIFSADEDLMKYESRIIAEHVTGDSYTELFINGYDLNARQSAKLQQVVSMRNFGMPLAYVLKSWEFRGLELFVDERVLIPRCETELVVQCAIDEIKELTCDDIQVIDLGTGSGAIAYSIANEVPNAKVYAADVSPEAVEVARLNGSAVGSAAARVEIVLSDLFAELPFSLKGNIDLIISNPPYIGLDEKEELDVSVLGFEPHLALFSGENGADHYERIISESIEWLKSGSKLVLEISPRHVSFIEAFSKSSGFSNCEIRNDLSGRERVAVLTN